MKRKIMDQFDGHYQDYYGRYLKGELKKLRGDECQGHCPFHEDNKPSFSFNAQNGVYFCHGCGEKGGIFNFYGKLCGIDTKTEFRKILRRIAEDFGISWQEGRGKLQKIYDYNASDGRLLFQVCRFEPKDFRQKRPDGNGGWVWNLKGVERVLYRLPDLAKSSEIFIVEGEKDADNLRKLGFVATCNSGGAGKWQDSYTQALVGKHCFIIPDRDEPGRKHADQVAAALHGKSVSVRIIDMPPEVNGKAIKDVSDFIAATGDPVKATEQISVLSKSAHEWFAPAQKCALPEPQRIVPGHHKNEKEKQADAMVRIGRTAELFVAQDRSAWARFLTKGHLECWPVRSLHSGFRQWLVSEFFREYATTPSTTAIQSAIEVIESTAQFAEGRNAREVFTRIADHEGHIYLDLADEFWRAVEISSEGWRVVSNPPVCFRRARAMLPLPEPKPGGNLELLDDLVNLGDEGSRRLILSWLLFTLNPVGPYPILIFVSEQGSGKSTTAKILRMIIDPNQAPIRALPKNLEDLAVAAEHSWMLNFDNLAHMPDGFSDAFCRLATGAGFAARQLYTNGEEFVFWAKRPVIMNGIVEPTTRADLLQRSLVVPLPTISPEKLRPESDIMAIFKESWPHILGGVLDKLVLLRRRLPKIELNKHTRMADFARWTVAAAPVFNAKDSEMLALLFEKQREALLSDFDNPLVQAVLKLVENEGGKVEMLLSELLLKLNEIAPEEAIDTRAWPKIPRLLSTALRRLAPILREAGVVVGDGGRTKKGKVISIERVSTGDDESGFSDDGVKIKKNQNHSLMPVKRMEIMKQTSFGDDGDDYSPIFSVEIKKRKEKEQEKEKPRILSSLSSPDEFRLVEI